MAATVSIRVFTGTNAGTMSNPVTGIDFSSDDSAENSLAHRQANPITVGGRSYEKWIKARVDVAPDNYVENFRIWGDGSVQANTHLYYGFTATGQTPTDNDSTVATIDFTTATPGSEATWHAGQLVNVGDMTQYLVFQLDVDAGASPGNWQQETINYSYDEA